MRELGLSRRRFGQGAGACLALAAAPGALRAEEPSEVRIKGFVFEPQVVTVRRGTTVQWTNDDIVPHTATSNDGAWETPGLAKGEVGEVTFSEAGTFEYFCAYHPHMKGTVIVAD